ARLGRPGWVVHQPAERRGDRRSSIRRNGRKQRGHLRGDRSIEAADVRTRFGGGGPCCAKMVRVTDKDCRRRTLLEVINQQVQGRVRGGETRVRTSALPLRRNRFQEQPRTPQECEDDDRGRRGALQALIPPTAPRGSRRPGHRYLFDGFFGEGEATETGRFRLASRCVKQRRSTTTEIAKDTLELRDPDPFLEV